MKIGIQILIVLGLYFISANTLVFGQQCRSQNPDVYEHDNYVVQSVSIESDDKIFARAVRDVPVLISQLPIRAGQLFTKANLDTSKRTIVGNSGYFDAGVIYVPFVEPSFENCSTNQVVVVFKVWYSVANVRFTPGEPSTYERLAAPSTPRITRNPVLKGVGSILQLEPFVGFTGSENLAGAGLTVNPKKSIFQRLSAQGGGSSSSALGSASLEGDRLFESPGLRTLTWRAGYEYSKLPGEDDLKLKKGTGFLQFFAESKSFGSEEFVLRYGAAVEGGNRQTNLDDSSIPAGDVASGGYKSLKTYVGASWRFGDHHFKSSYGLQLGGTNEQSAIVDKPVDFLKHIFDSAYKVRFFPWDNKPLSLEAQFTAGRIDRRGVIPVAEQFFGGNVDENFITGSDWQIRTAPFIRSFSGKRLTVSDSLLPLGGERFVSFNATLAATFWSKPAFPKEVRAEVPVAFTILKTHPKAKIVRDGLTMMFTVETKSYAEQIATVDSTGLENELLALQLLVTSIPTGSVTPATQNLRRKSLRDIRSALRLIRAFKAKTVFENGVFVTTSEDARPELFGLVTASFDDNDNIQPGFLMVIIMGLDELIRQRDPGVDPVLANLVTSRASLQTFFDSLTTKLATFDTAPNGKPLAEANAMRFLQDLEAQIDEIGRKLNIVSVGPVLMFDAARLNMENQRSGFRYGVGTGLAVDFFGLQLTGGYSWNPNRRLGEPKGAVVFSFNVTDVLQ
jgi:hypothetical protein